MPQRHCRSFPWAFLLALVIVASIEVGLRAIGPEALVAYEQGVPSRYAARHHILAAGTADVCFVGSSRTNNGINCPIVNKELGDALGQEITVANYASGGAQTPELVPLVRFMLRHSRPKVVLFGVEPEQLATKDAVNERSAVFWNLSDFCEARERFGPLVDSYLPEVIRNEIELHYFTLRARGRTGNLLRELSSGISMSHPLRGDSLYPYHIVDSNPTMSISDTAAEQIRKHVISDHLVDGAYPFSDQRIESLRELIELCRNRNVPLVFFEVPDSAIFSSFFPPDTHQRFVNVFRQISASTPGVRFVSLDELKLEFTDADFRDPVHLNLAGATRLSQRLSQQVIAPICSIAPAISKRLRQARQPAANNGISQ